MATTKRSKRFEFSWYDIKSAIVYTLIIIAPALIAQEWNIKTLLLSWWLSPELVAVIISVWWVFIKKFLTDYTTKENV